MAIQGNLKTPTSEPIANATIRVVAAANSGDVIIGTMSQIITGAAGEYSFNLAQGSYTFEVKQFDREYILSGSAIIDGNTPAVITLPELLHQYEVDHAS